MQIWMKCKNNDVRNRKHFSNFRVEVVVSGSCCFKIDISYWRTVTLILKFSSNSKTLCVKIINLAQKTCAVFHVTIKFIFSSIIIWAKATLPCSTVFDFFPSLYIALKATFNFSLKKKVYYVITFFDEFVNYIDWVKCVPWFFAKFKLDNIETIELDDTAR